MTLLDDLRSIDLSGVLDARASIRVSVEAPGVRAILEKGVAASALGELGETIARLRTDHPDGAQLLEPIASALRPLLGKITIDSGALQQYLESVQGNCTIISELLNSLSLQPSEWRLGNGLSLGGAFDAIGRAAEQASGIGIGNASGLRQILESLERGTPRDPQAFADLALDLCSSGPSLPLRPLRDAMRGALGALQELKIPPARTAGLIASLGAVERAGLAADAVALRLALAELEATRSATIASLSNDITALFGPIANARLEKWLRPALNAIPEHSGVGLGSLEMLEKARAAMEMVRRRIEVFDPDDLKKNLRGFLDFLETVARREVEAPIDAQVRKLDAWLRDLLARNPVRLYRAQLSLAIHRVAQTIADANLDAPAELILSNLEELRRLLDPEVLFDSVRAALEEVREQITNAVESVVEALEQAKAAVDAATSSAVGIVERATDAAESFQGSIEAIVGDADQLGITQASAQIVAKIESLRQTAEELLSVAPLPEPMRPQVEQLISAVESIDLAAAFEPIEATVRANLQIPTEALAPVKEGLEKLRDILANLVPEELISALDSEITKALDEFRKLDPGALIPEVGSYLSDAAQHVEALDPRQAAAAVRAPFEKVLEALDAIHPEKLLAPAIQLYDDVMGHVPIPKPQEAVQKLDTLVRNAGDRMVDAAGSPARELFGAGATNSSADPGAAPQSAPPTLEPIKAGDAIRLLGWIPMKLREGLAAMESGPAGEVVQILDSLTSGLARDLRRARRAVAESEAHIHSQIDEILEPVARAQVRAQLAIQRGFRAQAGSVEVRASVRAVSLSSPGAIRAAIDGPMVRLRREFGAAAGPGTLGHDLERAAARIEKLSISQATTGIDALLNLLDPEPIAAELDALVAAVLAKMPEVANAIDSEIRSLISRFTALIRQFHPMVQAQKFLQILETLRKELDLLNPRRLAAELAEVHSVLRATIQAYDPMRLAEKVHAVLQEIAASLRALDPSELLGDLTFLDGLLARIEAASPAAALAGVDASLEEAGTRLAQLDPAALLASLDGLAPKILDDLQKSLEAIRQEILALLQAIRFASGSASASVEVSVGG